MLSDQVIFVVLKQKRAEHMIPTFGTIYMENELVTTFQVIATVTRSQTSFLFSGGKCRSDAKQRRPKQQEICMSSVAHQFHQIKLCAEMEVKWKSEALHARAGEAKSRLQCAMLSSGSNLYTSTPSTQVICILILAPSNRTSKMHTREA